jgi:glycine oxidase
VVVAAVHFRNGILLAPITARLVADLVLTGTADPIIDDFTPGRFGCA